MEPGFNYYDKLLKIMDAININGFHLHDLEDGKVYEWTKSSGSQPLDEIESVIAYRGQDIMTYYFVPSDGHVLTAELVNRHVDWPQLNNKCKRDLLRIFTKDELRTYVKSTLYSSSFPRHSIYICAFLQIMLLLHASLMEVYETVLKRDIKEPSYCVKCLLKHGGTVDFSNTAALTKPLEEYLQLHGLEGFRQAMRIPEANDIVVLCNKDLTDEDYNFDIPYGVYPYIVK